MSIILQIITQHNLIKNVCGGSKSLEVYLILPIPHNIKLWVVSIGCNDDWVCINMIVITIVQCTYIQTNVATSSDNLPISSGPSQ